MYNETKMWPNLLVAILCTTMQETSQQVTGNGPGWLKKLAQLPKFKVKETGTNTPQIISIITALDATACATYLKIKIQLWGVTAFAMIDSSVIENFMSYKFVKNPPIPRLLKRKLYQLTVVNGIPVNQNEMIVK